jgi:hypothetical protein
LYSQFTTNSVCMWNISLPSRVMAKITQGNVRSATAVKNVGL